MIFPDYAGEKLTCQCNMSATAEILPVPLILILFFTINVIFCFDAHKQKSNNLSKMPGRTRCPTLKNWPNCPADEILTEMTRNRESKSFGGLPATAEVILSFFSFFT